jgi:hypothetical protein
MMHGITNHGAFVTCVIKSWRENRFAMHITDAEIEQMIQYPETMLRACAKINSGLFWGAACNSTQAKWGADAGPTDASGQ